MATHRPALTLPQPIRRTIGLLGLLLALLWAPVWGQWHGIAHGVRSGSQSLVQADAVQRVTAAQAAPLDQDNTHTSGSLLCQVLDHLAHASGLASAHLQLPLVSWPVLAVLGHLQAGVAQRPASLAQARAPPL